jgi:tight adherence protein B
MVLIFGGVAVFLLLLVGMVITMTSERSLVEQRLGRYIQEEAAAARRGREPAWLETG